MQIIFDSFAFVTENSSPSVSSCSTCTGTLDGTVSLCHARPCSNTNWIQPGRAGFPWTAFDMN